jgi:uncharacterized protein YjbI with pentapeptide repeats
MNLQIKQKGSKEFLLSVVQEYNNLLTDPSNNQYSSHKVSLDVVDFSNVDLSGLDRRSIEIFDFTGSVFNGSKLDRVLLDNILHSMRLKKIIYSKLDLSYLYLGSKILERNYLGVRCNVLMNFTGLDLKEFNFTGSNISEAIFDDCDLTGTIFVDCLHIKPIQFVKTQNYHMAKFFNDTEKDEKFKKEIAYLQEKQSVEVSKPQKTVAHSFLATLLDPADSIRFDDPHYIAVKKKAAQNSTTQNQK